MMKVCLGLLLTVASAAFAGTPSREAVRTCLQGEQLYDTIRTVELNPNVYVFDENYRSGYNLVHRSVGNIKFGVAEKGERQAIFYNGALYPLSRARAIPGFNKPADEVQPHLSDWRTVEEPHARYLCANTPTGALGMSGSFQYVRAVFLLQISPRKGAGALYSAFARVRPVLSSDASHSSENSPDEAP